VSTTPPSSDPELPHDPVFGTLNELTRMLRNLDDRGLVLSLAAFAEDALGSLLRELMIPSEATKQLLEGFNAPLGTFSARVKACLALGLITKDQYTDLEHLRKIRNEFAHHWRHLDFSSHSVSAHVRALSYGSLTNHFTESATEKVRESLTSLLIALRSTTHQIQNKKWQATVRGTRLIAGFPLGPFEEQLTEATAEFEALCSALEAAVGERRKFQEMLMRRFASKMGLLYLNCPPEDRNQLGELEAKVTSALHGMSK
jgi:DNA-binding MltR family transcriptional regulator